MDGKSLSKLCKEDQSSIAAGHGQKAVAATTRQSNNYMFCSLMAKMRLWAFGLWQKEPFGQWESLACVCPRRLLAEQP